LGYYDASFLDLSLAKLAWLIPLVIFRPVELRHRLPGRIGGRITSDEWMQEDDIVVVVDGLGWLWQMLDM
jgi:hypothetical protein